MARVRMVEGQLALDLFPMKEFERDVDTWIEWLVTSCKVADDGVSLARRIFDELPWFEATSRCKVVPVLSGDQRIEGFTVDDVDLFGVFDQTLHYHVCWDRKYAAWKGVPKERIPYVDRWDYGKGVPVFREEV